MAADTYVLAVTFTNRAANEMRDRMARLAPRAVQRTRIGTFHQICLAWLRELGDRTGLPAGFTVTSENEIETVARRAWPELARTERVTKLSTARAWKGDASFEDEPEEARRYTTALRQLGLVDFDDLIRETVRMLRDDPRARDIVRPTIGAVCVDEFQDIDRLQQDLLALVAGDDVPITVIGDPDQSIYGFRGSSSRAFEQFKCRYPDTHRIYLTENYRNAGALLSACGQVIAPGRSETVPELVAALARTGRLVVREAPTDKAEAEYVVHQIERMVGGTGMFSHDSGRAERHGTAERSFGDIGVLYRLNSQATALREAFERSGVPYRVSGDAPLRSHPLAADLLTALRLASGGSVAINGVERLLVRRVEGAGKQTADGLLAGLDTIGLSVLHERALASDGRSRSPLVELCAELRHAGRLLAAGPVSETLAWLTETPRWRKHLDEFTGRAAWQRLRHEAQRHENPADFIDTLLMGRADDGDMGGTEHVALMTLHAAKGLEFPVVFIVGCEERLLPLDLEGREGDVDEERRLFYVGMSRARESLYLVRARRRVLLGKGFENRASRFLADIEDVLKEYDCADVWRRRKESEHVVGAEQMDLFAGHGDALPEV